MKYFLAIVALLMLFLSDAIAFTEPPEISVSLPTGGTAKYLSNTGSGCSNGDTDYDPATDSCGSGTSTVYTTLQNANGNVGAGNILYTMPGNFTWTGTWTESGSGVGSEVVIKAYGGGDTILNVGAGNRFYLDASYVTFDGGSNRELIWDGSNQGDGDILIYPYGGTQYNTFWRCIIRNAGRSGSTDGGGKYTDWTIVGFSGIGDYLKVYNCEITGSAGAGFYGQWGPNRQDIRNNLIYSNGGTGLQYNPHGTTGNGYAADVGDVYIVGNMVWDNGKFWSGGVGNIRPGITTASSDNAIDFILIANNIVWDNEECGIKQENDHTNATIRYYHNTVDNNTNENWWLKSGPTYYCQNNISSNNNGTDTINGATVSNYWSTAPTYVSTVQANANFLNLDSSDTNAKDQGVDLSAYLSSDIYDTSRPQGSGWDIGAFEYSSGGDTTDPVTVISDSDPKNVQSSSTTLNGSSSDANGIDECKWRSGAAPDESNGTSCSGTTSWSCSVTGLGEGSNTIYVGCSDPSNNWGSDSITVNYSPLTFSSGSGSVRGNRR